MSQFNAKSTASSSSELTHNSLTVNPLIYCEKAEKICFNKCLQNPLTPSFDLPEKSCLERCARKFREAEEFGFETLRYLKHKLVEAQKEEPVNPLQKKH